jgi:hypothetical protein
VGGTYTLAGTTGQPDAGVLTEGPYRIQGGFWTGWALATAVEPPPEAARPLVFRIQGAYPNPFNPRTTFVFDLPAPRSVRLEVLNVRGERIRTLMDEAQDPGTHRAVWNGRDDVGAEVASGVYFFRLRAGEFEGRRKVTLVR